AVGFDHWARLPDDDIRRLWRHGDMIQTYRQLATACQGADVLVASTLQGAAPMVHERFDTPWITVSLLPMQFPHEDQPAPTVTGADRQLWDEMIVKLNQIRADLGFEKLTADELPYYWYSDRLTLLASSTHFSQPLLEHVPHVRPTGFWFDNDLGDW